MIKILFNKFNNVNLLRGHLIEIIWTIIPIFILIILVIPSLKILYLLDEIINPILTVKALGNQWFWSYQIEDFPIEFDSVILNEDYNFLLLEVDNNLILPYNLEILILIRSNDVIHSFTVPNIGIKVDAIPGLLNEISLLINLPGIYYGQCSEICGINHRFIPIVVEVNRLNNFISFLFNFN